MIVKFGDPPCDEVGDFVQIFVMAFELLRKLSNNEKINYFFKSLCLHPLVALKFLYFRLNVILIKR